MLTTISDLLSFLGRPLAFLADGLGLSSFQAFVVIGMMVTGAYVQWQFQFGQHAHDDHDE